MATRYVDLVEGSEANDGNTAATPKKLLITSLVAGDIMKVKASPAPVAVENMSASYWQNLSKAIPVSFGADFNNEVGTSRVADALTGAQNSQLATASGWAANSATASTALTFSSANRVMAISGISTADYLTASQSVDSIVRGNYYVLSTANLFFPALLARMISASQVTYYSIGFIASTGQWNLRSTVNSSTSTLASCILPVIVGQSFQLELRVIGSKIQVLFDGNPIITVVNTAITTTGYCGVMSYNAAGSNSSDVTGIHLTDIEVFNADTTNGGIVPPIKDIDRCDTIWTAGDRGTTPTLDNSSYKKFNGPSTSRITAATPTGLVCYKTLGSAVDFSAYQTVSFWVRVSSAQSGSASRLSLRLCSDTAGVTAVNIIPIPVMSSASRWTLVTYDTGGNLGASIQSIALYTDVALSGAANVYLDNIIACQNTSNSLNLTSMIGKHTSGETYYGIQSIGVITNTGCVIYLDNQTETAGNAGRGYWGTTETVALWKRDPITLTQNLGAPLAAGGTLYTPGFHGTALAPAIIKFGYSDLTLTDPDDETWIDFQNGSGNVCQSLSNRYLQFSGLSVVRSIAPFASVSGIGIVIRMGTIANNTASAVGLSNNSMFPEPEIDIGYSVNGGVAGINTAGLGHAKIRIGKILNNLNIGISALFKEVYKPLSSVSSVIYVCNNGSNAVWFAGSDVTIFDLFSANNGSGIGLPTSPGTSGNRIIRYSGSEAITGGSLGISQSIAVIGNASSPTARKTYYFNANVESDATVVHSTSPFSWKADNNSSGVRTTDYPVEFKLGRIACKANQAVTVTAWVRTDRSSWIPCLKVKGWELAGIDNDVMDTLSVDINTWEQLNISFTPTESGFINIWFHFYSTSGSSLISNCWIDDIVITGEASASDLADFGIIDLGMAALPNIEPTVSGGGSSGIRTIKL
jgi:hypothetical protein